MATPLIQKLAAEYYAEDLADTLPPEAASWSEDKLRAWFDKGGDKPASASSATAPVQYKDAPEMLKALGMSPYISMFEDEALTDIDLIKGMGVDMFKESMKELGIDGADINIIIKAIWGEAALIKPKPAPAKTAEPPPNAATADEQMDRARRQALEESRAEVASEKAQRAEAKLAHEEKMKAYYEKTGRTYLGGKDEPEDGPTDQGARRLFYDTNNEGAALPEEEETTEAPWSTADIPKPPFTVDQAYEIMGLKKPEKRGDLEGLKTAYRKLCMKWHPDKNRKQKEYATEMFKAVNAAYHTLTTNNFDYDRWARNFKVPPMQSLEDVLQYALSGADPYEVEAMLRKRGDYRPHQDFGVNLSIPWNAGSKSDPTYDVPVGSEYNNTEALDYKRRMEELEYRGGGGASALVEHYQVNAIQGSLASQLGEDKVAGASTDRPWERVGGSGFGASAPAKKYVKPAGRPDVAPGDKEASAVAQDFNDQGLAAYKLKNYQQAYDLISESVRLQPEKVIFRANRAAFALKMNKPKYTRSAADDCMKIYKDLDPTYAKAWLRAGEAHRQMGDVPSLRLAVKEYNKCLELEPTNKTAKAGLKDAEISLMAEDSD